MSAADDRTAEPIEPVGSAAGSAPSGPSAAPAAQPAAFFDLDRTLVSGSSGFSILVEMTRAGIIRRRQLARDTYVSARFRLWGLDDETTDLVRARVGGYLAGVPETRIQAIADAVLARVLPRVYPDVIARAHAHQAAGEPVYLVTASSQEFADVLAAALDLDGAIGTRSEVVDGHYTGRAGGPFIYGEGKVHAMTELAAVMHLDLGQSTAYSDSISDLPMLRAVGHPVAVNPDRQLAEIARAEGWEVLAIDGLARRLTIATRVVTVAAATGLAVTAVTRGLRSRRPSSYAE